MQPESRRSPEPSGETLLPPALTLRHPLADPADGPDAPLAPFFAGRPDAGSGGAEDTPAEVGFAAVEAGPAEEAELAAASVDEAEWTAVPADEAEWTAAPAEGAEWTAASVDEAEWADAAAEGAPWEDVPSDAGLVERDDGAFLIAAPPDEADLVAEEDTLVLLEEVPAEGMSQQRIADEVAERLEMLAGRLRQSGLDALDANSGDAIDTVLAAVLSGYVAARSR